jgi:hypothetical protein
MLFSIVMQTLSILLTSISLRQYFDALYAQSIKSLDKLITWLQYMRKTSDVAERAYEVAHNIIRAPDLSDLVVWKDIAHMFPDAGMSISGSTQQQIDPNVYMPWSGAEQGLQPQFGFQGGGYDFYPV